MKAEFGKWLVNKSIVIFVLCLASAIFLIAGYIYYKSEKESIVSDRYNQIKSITELKRSQIENWLKERRADASVVSSAPFINKAIALWVKNDCPGSPPAEIIERLTYVMNAYEYEDIIICVPNSKKIFSILDLTQINDPPIEETLFNKNIGSENQSPNFSYCSLHKKVHLDIITPLITNNSLNVFILFRVDPNKFLYPFLQTWPTRSLTSETFLTEVIGDSILYLNELRHLKGTALKFKVPILDIHIPAIQAALGKRGIFEGIDYRGVKVLSYLTNIDQTNWNLISKIDRDEIFEELTFRSAAIAIVTLFLIFVSGASIAYVYYSRQRDMYKDLYLSEQKLSSLNETYKTTLYSIGDAVITTGIDGKVNQMNPIAEELTGWSEAEAKNLPLEKIFVIIDETSGEFVESPVQKVISKGLIVGLANHTVLISKVGKKIPIADSGAPIKNSNGEIIGVVLVFRDQTEERENQVQLTASEEKFRDIVTYLDEAYYSVTLDGILLDHNPGFNRVFGFKPEKDLRGTRLINFWVNPAERETYLSELTKNGFIRNYIIEAKRVDGMLISNLVNCHLVKSEDGTPLRIEGTFIDVTEKRRNEAAIEANEKRLKTLFSLMNELVIVVDKKGYFVDIEASNPSMLYISESEAIGKKVEEIFPPEKANYFIKKIDEAFLSEKPVAVEYSLNIGGSDLWFEGKFSKVTDNNVMMVVHDITERKAYEEKITQSEQRFKDLAELLPQIVFETDEKGMLIYANRIAFETVANLKDDFEKGVYVLNLLVPEDRERAAINFQKRISGELSGYTEYTAYGKNGKLTPIVIYASPIVKQNKVSGLRGVIIDITEIKQANELILNEKEFSEALIEKLPGVFYLFDRNGKFKKWNKNFELVTGYTSEEVANMSPLEFFRGDDSKLIENRIGRVFIEEKADAEALFTTKDGRQIPYYFTGNLILIDDEPHLVGTGIDITERVEAIKSLRQFHDAVNESGDVVFTTDKEGIITSINNQFTKLYGFTEDDVIGKVTPRILKSGVHGDEVYKSFWEAVLSGNTFRGEVVNKTKSGELFYIEETVNPISDASGEVIGFLAIQRDISERVNYQKEIEKRNSELSSLNKLAKELVGSISLDTTIDSIIENVASPMNATIVILFEVNDNKLELIKVGPRGNVYHQNPEEILHLGECLCGRAVFDKKSIFSLDICKDNRCTRKECKNAGIVSFACIPLFSGSEVMGALGIGSNEEIDFEKSSSFLNTAAEEFGLALNNINLYSEMKKLNEELEKLNEELDRRVVQRTTQLEEANRELESFSYSVSHDLRAPVRAVAGFAKILQDDHIKRFNKEGKELLADILMNTTRMAQLIDDLLAFSRLHKTNLAKSLVSMHELFESTYDEVKIHYSNLKIDFRLEKIPSSYCDYSLMKQVVTNLLSNALKFSSKEPKSVVIVSANELDEQVIYSVSDNGVGFDMKYSHKLFGVFQRLHALDEFEGTGVGLAIVHRIIQRHDGKVWAESEQNEGTTFYFSIPKLLKS